MYKHISIRNSVNFVAFQLISCAGQFISRGKIKTLLIRCYLCESLTNNSSPEDKRKKHSSFFGTRLGQPSLQEYLSETEVTPNPVQLTGAVLGHWTSSGHHLSLGSVSCLLICSTFITDTQENKLWFCLNSHMAESLTPLISFIQIITKYQLCLPCERPVIIA